MSKKFQVRAENGNLIIELPALEKELAIHKSDAQNLLLYLDEYAERIGSATEPASHDWSIEVHPPEHIIIDLKLPTNLIAISSSSDARLLADLIRSSLTSLESLNKKYPPQTPHDPTNKE